MLSLRQTDHNSRQTDCTFFLAHAPGDQRCHEARRRELTNACAKRQYRLTRAADRSGDAAYHASTHRKHIFTTVAQAHASANDSLHRCVWITMLASIGCTLPSPALGTDGVSQKPRRLNRPITVPKVCSVGTQPTMRESVASSRLSPSTKMAPSGTVSGKVTPSATWVVSSVMPCSC